MATLSSTPAWRGLWTGAGREEVKKALESLRANLGAILLVLWVVSILISGLVCFTNRECGEALWDTLRDFLAS